MNNLKVTENKGLVQVVLSRPQVKNALSEEMISELTQVFSDLSLRKDIRAIGLSAEGNHFCAGADLNWMKKMAGFSFSENQTDAGLLFDMFGAIRNCPIPIIGAVQGSVYGGGLGLLAVCDHVVTTTTSLFCFSEVKLGLVPAVISSFILEKCVPSLAQSKMLSGQLFDSVEAQRIGLVHQIVAVEKLPEEFDLVLEHFATLGPEAVRETKKLIRQTQLDDWTLRRSLSTKVIAERRASFEGQEGLKAFFDSRKPNWSQR